METSKQLYGYSPLGLRVVLTLLNDHLDRGIIVAHYRKSDGELARSFRFKARVLRYKDTMNDIDKTDAEEALAKAGNLGKKHMTDAEALRHTEDEAYDLLVSGEHR